MRFAVRKRVIPKMWVILRVETWGSDHKASSRLRAVGAAGLRAHSVTSTGRLGVQPTPPHQSERPVRRSVVGEQLACSRVRWSTALAPAPIVYQTISQLE